MKPLRIFAVAAVAAATVPRLAHRGMFVDGVTYASIARNLAEGRGSFWSPSYTATLYPQFHEHPPLGFWLQSLWFRLLGDHLFVERIYTLTAGMATAALIAIIWRRLPIDDDERGSRHDAVTRRSPGFPDALPASSRVSPWPRPDGHNDLDWLPVVLWIVVPVVSWAIVGNLLETTVSVLTTAAVAAAWQAMVTCSRAHPDRRDLAPTAMAIGWSLLSGLCIVAAGLTKGPVGLFPLVAPIAFASVPIGIAVQRGGWRGTMVAAVLPIAAQWVTVAGCGALLWASPIAQASLVDYLQQQVMPALAGRREVSSSSVTIVKAWLQGVWLPMAGIGVLAAALARRFVVPSAADRRRALLFCAIGLAGTLPILASAKQAGHYLVPAVPLFALAAAMIVGPTVRVATGLDQRRAETGSAPIAMKVINIVTALLVAGTVVAAVTPALGRDRQRMADLDALDPRMPRDRIVGLCPESNDDWGLHAWFERRFRVSLDAGAARPDWFLRTAGAAERCVPPPCAAVTDPRRRLVLMRCRWSD